MNKPRKKSVESQVNDKINRLADVFAGGVSGVTGSARKHDGPGTGVKVSLDGGRTWRSADEVRIAYEGIPYPMYDEPGNTYTKVEVDLRMVATYEGIITDVYCQEESIGTSSEMADEIVERLTSQEQERLPGPRKGVRI